jgi:glutamyl-tRNA synthetase
MIAEIVSVLESLSDWEVEPINMAIRAYAESKELKLGKVAQPLRAALTGKTVSPGVFEVMVLIGRQETLARLQDQSETKKA